MYSRSFSHKIKHKKIPKVYRRVQEGVHERESDSSCFSSGKRKPYAF